MKIIVVYFKQRWICNNGTKLFKLMEHNSQVVIIFVKYKFKSTSIHRLDKFVVILKFVFNNKSLNFLFEQLYE